MVKSSGVLAVVAWVPLAAAPVLAQPKLEIDRFETSQAEQGLALVVGGSLTGGPERTRVRVVVSLEGGEGPVQVAEVHGGRFTARLGPFRQRVLPGKYETTGVVHESLQLVDVAPLLSGVTIAPAKHELVIGTPEEAAAEKAKLLRSYSRLVEGLRLLRASLDMWGTSSTLRTIAVRLGTPTGELPARARDPILREWTRYVDDDFLPELASLRAFHRETGELVLLGYFPRLEPLLVEITSNLERMQAAFTVAIHRNLGLAPPREMVLRAGGFGLGDLRTNIDGLAANAYHALGIAPQTWTLDALAQEKLEDAQGDLFHSTVTKFEVRKPTPWTFDVNATSPGMRLRMVPPKELVGRVAAGVQTQDFPSAESFADLADLDEALARNTHPGFELKKVKRIGPPDPTMPQGIRPGQEIRFTTAGEKGARFFVLRYTLFCRWHKRTYTLMCIAPEGEEGRWEATFSAMCQSFKVLDAPHHQAAGGHRDGR